MNREKTTTIFTNKFLILVLFGLIALGLLIGFTPLISFLCILFCLLLISLLLLKFSLVFTPGSRITVDFDPEYQPRVCIQVACKSEPAKIVNKTLEALTLLDYSDYEVHLIHSNDKNTANYHKIQKYVEQCGDNFRFVHLDKVSGFKAGALNYLNENYVGDNIDIIAVIDCDYLVSPDFLKKTVGYFKDPNVAIVQLPQSYYNVNPYNKGLFYEFRSFFSLVMHQAQRFNMVCFTGTMGLIRADLLQKEMRWDEACITEDLEAGILINTLGYRGVYVDETLGKGLMPFDYPSFANQRERWTYGNMQILMKDSHFVIQNQSLSLKQKTAFISLVTAWFHFELVLALLYILLAVITLTTTHNKLIDFTSHLLQFTLILTIITNLGYFLVGMRKETCLKDRIAAFLTHYGILWSMASSWIYCIIGKKLDFVVTNKEISKDEKSLIHYWREFIIPLLFIIGFIIRMLTHTNTAFDFWIILIFILIEIIAILYICSSFNKVAAFELKNKGR